MIGTQPDLSALNSMLAADAVTLRDACAGIRARWQYVEAIGEEALTGPPWNMPADQAAEMFAAFNYLATVALVYFGRAAQAEEFDFDAQLATVRGGS
jgi:hypothetical protein